MKRRRGDNTTTRRVSASPRPRVSPSANRNFSRAHFPLVTLLTDFGAADYFVGAVKGVILSSAAETRIVDLTHEIPAQDIEAAAFTLLASYKSFPEKTVHLAVVDPGVGSARRGICVVAGKQIFVGPDNGIFSYIYEREPAFTVFELSNKKYFREPMSATFHGRDVFAPVAAALAEGTKPSSLGKRIADPVRLKTLVPETREGEILARIIHIDRFGNCITNLTTNELTEKAIDSGARVMVGGKEIRSFRNFYAEATDDRAKVFCIWGSAGFLEISATNDSAAKLLNIDRGDPVKVRLNL